MTDDNAAVRTQPPPILVIKLLNPLMRVLLRSPLARRMPAGLVVLSFTGRRSRRNLEIPVGLHEVDGVPCVFTDRPWRLNFRGGHPVTVIRQGRRLPGRGVLVENQDEVAPALEAAIRTASSPRRLGLSARAGHQPTRDELAAVGRSMIRLHLGAD